MAKILDTQTGQVADVPDEVAGPQVRTSTRFVDVSDGRVPVLDQNGLRGSIDVADYGVAVSRGYRPLAGVHVEDERLQEQFGDQTAKAAAAGVARGATLGLSDVALTQSGVAAPETLRELKKRNPTASTLGEVGGVVAATVLTRGRNLTPAGAVARASTALGTEVAANLGGRALVREAVAGAFEGGLQNLGSLVSERALEETPELTAQRALAAMGTGALIGGAFGAGMGALDDALARRTLGTVADEAPAAAARAGPAEAAPAPAPSAAPPPAAAAAGETAAPASSTAPAAAVDPMGSPDAFDQALGAAGQAADRFRRGAEQATQRNVGTLQRIWDALDFGRLDAREFVVRAYDLKKAALGRMRAKNNLDERAAEYLLQDPRFALARDSEARLGLLEQMVQENGQAIGQAVRRLDEVAQPGDLFNPVAFAGRAEEELIRPLMRGTLDERRAGRRLRAELRALIDGAQPPVTPRPAGVYEVPLAELDDVPAVAWDAGRAARVRQGLDEGVDLGPIRIGQGEDGLREVADGNHRLALARERGERSIRVEFLSDEAAALQRGRARGTHVMGERATAPMDAPGWAPPPQGLNFTEVERIKRALDRSLKWDSTTPNVVRDELRRLRGMLNADQEARVAQVSQRTGEDLLSGWREAKARYGALSEFQQAALQRLADAKKANRVFSLTDNIFGAAMTAVGGGLNPVGIAMGLGAMLVNKWGRERLPHVLALALWNLERNPAQNMAARAFRRLVMEGDEAGAGAAGAAARAERAAAAAGEAGEAGATAGAAAQAAAGAQQAAGAGSRFGQFTPLLRRVAGLGAAELWAIHTALGADPAYRAQLEAAGLPTGPEVDREGQQRAAQLGKLQAATAAGDARLDRAIEAMVSGKRPRLDPSDLARAQKDAERIAQLAGNPEALVAELGKKTAELARSAPSTSAAMVQTAERALTYLSSKAPKPPVPPLDVPQLKRPWKPTDLELQRFAGTVAGVLDPLGTMEAVAGGRVSREQVEAVRTVYPELFAHVRERLVAKLSEAGSQKDYQKRLSYPQALALGKLLDLPLERAADPRIVAITQAVYQGEQQRQQAQRAARSQASTARTLAQGFSESQRLASKN